MAFLAKFNPGNSKIFLGIGALMLCFVHPSALAATNPFSGANCEAEGEKVVNGFRVTTPYVPDARLVDLRPDALCRKNSNVAGNSMRQSSNSMESVWICENTYTRAKNAIEEYRRAVVNTCRIAQSDTAIGCGANKIPDECNALKFRQALAADEAAARSLLAARKEVREFTEAADNAHATYVRDKAEIVTAIEKHEAKIKAARLANNTEEVKRLVAIKDQANGVRNGELVTDMSAATADDRHVIAWRGSEAKIDDYRKKIEAGLMDEQALVRDTGVAFESKAKLEHQARLNTSNLLRSQAVEFELRASKQRQEIVDRSGGSSMLSGITNVNPATAMAAMGAMGSLASLANQGSGVSAGNDSLTPAATGVIGPKPITTSSFGEKGGAGASVPGGPSDKKNPGAPGADPSQSFAQGESGLEFATGRFNTENALGDYKPEEDGSGAGGRGLASGGAGGGNGRMAEAGKKKEKSEADCKKDKNCVDSMGLETAQFNKGGSLGVPVVGSSDPGLGTLGALDSLFGPLPTESTASPAKGGLAAGLDWALGGVFSSGDPALPATQTSREIANADSLSLFKRIRGVHENALKRGSVSLFHKKL